MRYSIVFAAALAIAGTASFAQAPVGARAGQTLRDANNGRIGTIDKVVADGSLQVIQGERFVLIPANTVTVADGVVKTSLTKQQVAKMR